MLLAISDASLLVDMADTNLLGPLTRLPCRFVVPDFVLREITRDEQREIVKRLVLANDSRMRKVSERKRLTCHGTLWIIRQLVQETIVTAERARRALLLLLEGSPRLPKADCDRLLRELE